VRVVAVDATKIVAHASMHPTGSGQIGAEVAEMFAEAAAVDAVDVGWVAATRRVDARGRQLGW
jgi:hypothetical protein